MIRTRRRGEEAAQVLGEGDRFLRPGSGRAERVAARRAEARARKQRRAQALAEGRAAAEARKAARREARAIPPAGERRARAGWDPFPVSVRPHRGTSAMLRMAYPFQAGHSLGSEGPAIGIDRIARAAFCWDPWVLYERGELLSPNWCEIGEQGRGKSSLSKTLALRNIAFGRLVYVPGDTKGEWGTVAEAAGGRRLSLAPGLPARVNPLDAGPRPAGVADAERWVRETEMRRGEVMAALGHQVLHRPLTQVEHTALHLGLRSCARPEASPGRQGTPTLPLLVEALRHPDPDMAGEVDMDPGELARESRDLALALRRLVAGDLAGLFDGPSTEAVDPGLPMLVVDTSRLRSSEELKVLTMTCVSSWMEAAIAEPDGRQRLVVYDEAWSIMAHPPLLRRMQAAWKLSRSYGAANGLIMHRLSDLDAVGDAGSEAVALAKGLVADTSTRICYQVRAEEVERTAEVFGLNDTESGMLRSLARGCGLWRVGEESFLVDHLVSPFERPLVDTDGAMTGKPTLAANPG